MGYSVKALLDDEKKQACADWHQAVAGRLWMREGSFKEDIEK